MLPDLKQLGSLGDLTEIGERGVTLSGGQKARISIARCVYAQPSVALFDDVLSALDASTGKWIFERLFCSSTKKERLLSNSAIVLVTHSSHFLSRVDNIMVLVKGKPAYLGDWDGLGRLDLEINQEAVAVIHSLRASVQEVHDASIGNLPAKGLKLTSVGLAEDNKDEENNAALMTGKITIPPILGNIIIN